MTSSRFVLIAIIPALVVAIVYEAFLGHRHDYTGHYAAGYGATLGVTLIWFRMLSAERFNRVSTIALGPLCVISILLGAAAEATVFRIAKFDEVDFCNQSLGAVLAMIVLISISGKSKPSDSVLDRGIIVSIVFLSAGGCFAVA